MEKKPMRADALPALRPWDCIAREKLLVPRADSVDTVMKRTTTMTGSGACTKKEASNTALPTTAIHSDARSVFQSATVPARRPVSAPLSMRPMPFVPKMRLNPCGDT